MNPRTLAVIVGAVVLAGAAGIGVTAGSDSSTATPSTMGRPGPGGPGGGFDLTALADELGVSESRLQDALEAARPSGGGGGPGAGAADLAETLADELGLPVDDVEAALEAVMPSGGPGGGPPPGTDDGTAPPARCWSE